MTCSLYCSSCISLLGSFSAVSAAGAFTASPLQIIPSTQVRCFNERKEISSLKYQKGLSSSQSCSYGVVLSSHLISVVFIHRVTAFTAPPETPRSSRDAVEIRIPWQRSSAALAVLAPTRVPEDPHTLLIHTRISTPLNRGSHSSSSGECSGAVKGKLTSRNHTKGELGGWIAANRFRACSPFPMYFGFSQLETLLGACP